MDVRSDVSSTHIGGQRLSSSLPPQFWGTRSPSTPTFSYHPGGPTFDEASFAHHTTALHHLNVSSRSNVRRHRHTKSIGPRSTLASQPVIVRVQSAHETLQTGPRIHIKPDPGRKPEMSQQPELPPVSDYSIDGILQAIEPDIQETLDAIAEIMGRSRLSLANEYGSHMPPQGEIRAPTRMALEHLFPVEEASSSNERLAADNVVIVGEDGGLIDGSTTGSAAYGLLERLRAVPSHRSPRAPVSSSWRDSSSALAPNLPSRTVSSPAMISAPSNQHSSSQDRALRAASRSLLRRDERGQGSSYTPQIATVPVVSEMYLAAGANGSSASNPPVVSESGRNYPLYSFDESALFEDPPADPVPSRLRSFQSQMQNLSLVRDLDSLAAWLYRENQSSHRSAETRLRAILER